MVQRIPDYTALRDAEKGVTQVEPTPDSQPIRDARTDENVAWANKDHARRTAEAQQLKADEARTASTEALDKKMGVGQDGPTPNFRLLRRRFSGNDPMNRATSVATPD